MSRFEFETMVRADLEQFVQRHLEGAVLSTAADNVNSTMLFALKRVLLSIAQVRDELRSMALDSVGSEAQVQRCTSSQIIPSQPTDAPENGQHEGYECEGGQSMCDEGLASVGDRILQKICTGSDQGAMNAHSAERNGVRNKEGYLKKGGALSSCCPCMHAIFLRHILRLLFTPEIRPSSVKGPPSSRRMGPLFFSLFHTPPLRSFDVCKVEPPRHAGIFGLEGHLRERGHVQHVEPRFVDF